jgi:superkiller protein 3
VFLGLAYDKLNHSDDSEQAYLAATRIKPEDRTAWQGLITLYDRLGGPKLAAYREAIIKLGQILADEYVLLLDA